MVPVSTAAQALAVITGQDDEVMPRASRAANALTWSARSVSMVISTTSSAGRLHPAPATARRSRKIPPWKPSRPGATDRRRSIRRLPAIRTRPLAPRLWSLESPGRRLVDSCTRRDARRGERKLPGFSRGVFAMEADKTTISGDSDERAGLLTCPPPRRGHLRVTRRSVRVGIGDHPFGASTAWPSLLGTDPG